MILRITSLRPLPSTARYPGPRYASTTFTIRQDTRVSLTQCSAFIFNFSVGMASVMARSRQAFGGSLRSLAFHLITSASYYYYLCLVISFLLDYIRYFFLLLVCITYFALFCFIFNDYEYSFPKFGSTILE